MLKTTRSRKRLLYFLRLIIYFAVASIAPIMTWVIGGPYVDLYSNEVVVTWFAWMATAMICIFVLSSYVYDAYKAINDWSNSGDEQATKDTRITELERKVQALTEENAELKAQLDPTPVEPGMYEQPPARAKTS